MVSNELLVRLSAEPNNPDVTFALAREYDTIGQNAPAISFYLKTAEYGYDTHPVLVYNALLLASKCFEKQTGRQHSVKNIILQAASYLPKRPEAWYFIALHSETEADWQRCYTYSELALSHASEPALPVDIGYPGPYALKYEKAISAWWIGRKDESQVLFDELLNSDIPEGYKHSIRYNMERTGMTMSNTELTPFQKYQQNGFDQVHGWVKRTLPAFLESIKDIPWNGEGGVCEIGTFQGRFFLQLRSLLPAAVNSYGIDVFEDQHLNIDTSGNSSATQEVLVHNVNTYDPFGGEMVYIIKGDSTTGKTQAEIYNQIPFGTIKYFSIDGGHTMAHVVNDMRIAERLLTDGGIVIMDDILHPHWMGVISGVTEYLRSHPTIVPFAVGYNKLFLCKMSYYDKYIEELKNNPHSQQLVTFMDKPIWGVEVIDWLL
jgi:tetratricopeptide (TPR) repeat protein